MALTGLYSYKRVTFFLPSETDSSASKYQSSARCEEAVYWLGLLNEYAPFNEEVAVWIEGGPIFELNWFAIRGCMLKMSCKSIQMTFLT